MKKKPKWLRKLKPEYKLLTGYILFLFIILGMISLMGCDSGWTIAGWEVK